MKVAVTALALTLYATCAASQTQLESDAMADRAFQKADRELNAVYAQITRRLSPAEKAKLVAAQRVWLQFRRSECDFESMSVEGGSAQPMIYSTCMEKLTAERIKGLRAITLDCHEGDLACVFVGND